MAPLKLKPPADFSRQGYLLNQKTAASTWEDSNLHIPDRKTPFEMSGEFPHIYSKFGVGDFCSWKLSILDTHPSLAS